MPMYDEEMVAPMRRELTSIGFQELKTQEAVEGFFAGPGAKGTALVMVNSVCGCAAGGARPGVAMAIGHRIRPQHLMTVFAGQDKDATVKARSFMVGFPPSSPSIALFRDGRVVAMLERKDIEGRPPMEIASALTQLFDQHCGVSTI